MDLPLPSYGSRVSAHEHTPIMIVKRAGQWEYRSVVIELALQQNDKIEQNMHKMAKKEKNQKLHRAISFFPKIGLKIIVFVQWDD